nr:hypothetical protein Iba_chr14dCG2700 [Ipomoea batatas]GME01542.1 hypothetical protein Iba_contig2029CG0010 [Ipomoea batatas]GME06638.1 hypothetical protein Iba_scaffold4858CG0060 [Ipomoea batatas]
MALECRCCHIGLLEVSKCVKPLKEEEPLLNGRRRQHPDEARSRRRLPAIPTTKLEAAAAAVATHACDSANPRCRRQSATVAGV